MPITDEKRRLVLRDIQRVYQRHGIVLEGDGGGLGGCLLTIEPATATEIETAVKLIR